MLVELGNTKAKLGDLDAPAVTTIGIPDDYTFDPNVDLAAFKEHLYNAPDGITNRPNDEALLSIVHAGGLWAVHSHTAKPSWVDSDNPEFAAVIGAYYGCPVGKPADVEETHYTRFGPPGVGPTVTEAL